MSEEHEESILILIVDDAPRNIQVLGNVLRENGYTVAAAQSGFSALEYAHKHRPDCILLDVMMPDMDGFETCRRLKASKATRDIPVLFITARTDTPSKLRAFEFGGVDYITKPFQAEEVIARVKTHLALHAMQVRLQAQNKELLRQRQELDLDLQAAAHIQATLIPNQPPTIPNTRVAWEFSPCQSVGGDIFHIYHVDDSHSVLYLVDVSGHGVSSAMLTVPIARNLSLNPNSLIKRACVSPPYYEIVPPAEVLNTLAQEYPLTRFNRYFSMVYLILDPRTGQVRYAKAGHPEPILVRTTGAVELLDASGPLIGLNAPMPFEEVTIILQPHDRLFLYTDGITECFNDQGHMYGEERLQQKLVQTRCESLESACQQVMASIYAYAGNTPLRDDVTLLACEFLGPSEDTSGLSRLH